MSLRVHRELRDIIKILPRKGTKKLATDFTD